MIQTLAVKVVQAYIVLPSGCDLSAKIIHISSLERNQITDCFSTYIPLYSMSHVKAFYCIYTIYNLPQKMNVWMNEISSKTDESWSMKADTVFSEYTVHLKKNCQRIPPGTLNMF